MDVAKIPIGRKPPDDVNVIVEIPQGGEPVKYELDKEKAPADPPRGRFLFPDMGSAARIADVSSRPWPLNDDDHMAPGCREQGAPIPSKPWKMTPTRHNPDIGIMRQLVQ